MFRVPHPPCAGFQFLGNRPFYESVKPEQFMGEMYENFHYVDDVDCLPFSTRELLQGIMLSSANISLNMDDCYDGECVILCCWGGTPITHVKYNGKDAKEYTNECIAREGIWFKISFETLETGSRIAKVISTPKMIQMLMWDLDGSDLAIPWFKETTYDVAGKNLVDIVAELQRIGFEVIVS